MSGWRKFWFGVGASAIVVLGFAAVLLWKANTQWLGAMIGVIGVISFVTFYRGEANGSAGAELRSAIAGSVIVVWLVFFGVAVFGPTKTIRDPAAKARTEAAANLSRAAQAVKISAEASEATSEVRDAATAVGDAIQTLTESAEKAGDVTAGALDELGASAEELKQAASTGDAEEVAEAAQAVSDEADAARDQLTQIADTAFTRELLADFRWVVIAVVSFYFGTEWGLAALKHWRPQQNPDTAPDGDSTPS